MTLRQPSNRKAEENSMQTHDPQIAQIRRAVAVPQIRKLASDVPQIRRAVAVPQIRKLAVGSGPDVSRVA
jgi:hypothetical protein